MSISSTGLGSLFPTPRKPGQASHHLNGRGSKLVAAQSEPGDEQIGFWTHEQLTRMDERFVAAVARAIRLGKETEVPEHDRPPEEEAAWLRRARRNVLELEHRPAEERRTRAA
jgi:hypothetical protein